MPQLALAGLNARVLQHQSHFRDRSRVSNGPKPEFTPPSEPPPPSRKLLATMRRHFDLQTLRVRNADRKQSTGTTWTEYSGLQRQLLGHKDEEIKNLAPSACYPTRPMR